MTDDLEATIAALVARRNACADGDSAECRMIERQLNGLRYTREEAGGIMEDYDCFIASPLPPAEGPERGQILPLPSPLGRKSVSRPE